MLVRGRLLAIMPLVALFLLRATAFAQQEPATAEEVVSRYMQAIGSDRFPSISTLVESGDIDGGPSSLRDEYNPPAQSGFKRHELEMHGTFESYFKRPNLRFISNISDKNRVLRLEGCDGQVSWNIDASSKHTEFKPKPGSEYDCAEGFQMAPAHLREPNVKMRGLKKKNIGGHMAWEIKVDAPESTSTETYYFDADTFLLLRVQTVEGSVVYSDYRDVQGIKLPFTVTTENKIVKLVTTLREVEIDAPIDDARFAEPHMDGHSINLNPDAPPNKHEGQDATLAAPAPQ